MIRNPLGFHSFSIYINTQYLYMPMKTGAVWFHANRMENLLLTYINTNTIPLNIYNAFLVS